jgi:hypothetical protein
MNQLLSLRRENGYTLSRFLILAVSHTVLAGVLHSRVPANYL